jgi:hypothetical protein
MMCKHWHTDWEVTGGAMDKEGLSTELAAGQGSGKPGHPVGLKILPAGRQ